MIRTFSCDETEKLFHGLAARTFPVDIRRRARTKLLVLHAATRLDDLKSPPGNRLEALTGDRKGQHSIRINQQYRLYFGNSPQFWINLQTHFDLEKATRESFEKIKAKVKPLAAA